jgi:hypothetical protein
LEPAHVPVTLDAAKTMAIRRTGYGACFGRAGIWIHRPSSTPASLHPAVRPKKTNPSSAPRINRHGIRKDWGVGPAFLLPTGTDPTLGQGKRGRGHLSGSAGTAEIVDHRIPGEQHLVFRRQQVTPKGKPVSDAVLRDDGKCACRWLYYSQRKSDAKSPHAIHIFRPLSSSLHHH